MKLSVCLSIFYFYLNDGEIAQKRESLRVDCQAITLVLVLVEYKANC